MRALRVYVDTSVFGGFFDPEFHDQTQRFFQQVRDGRFRLVVSPRVSAEILPAPPQVKEFYELLLPMAEMLVDAPDVEILADSYRDRGAVGKSSLTDALHVAFATLNRCDGLVSWNFKHIVQPDKAIRFNLINAEKGLCQLFIATPEKVLNHE